MHSGALHPVRRVLALLALFATVSGVAAPVCALAMGEGAPASHCEGPKDAGMPGHEAPAGAPAHHHSLVACASGVCVSAPFASNTLVAVTVPVPSHPQSVEAALTSAAPQHTTPPPRS